MPPVACRCLHRAILSLTTHRLISSVRAQANAADRQQSLDTIRCIVGLSLDPQPLMPPRSLRDTPCIQLAAMPCVEAGVVRFAFSVSVQKCDYCACGAMTLRGVGGAGGKVETTVKMCVMAVVLRVKPLRQVSRARNAPSLHLFRNRVTPCTCYR